MAEEPEGVVITFREIYDQIVLMRGDVRSLTENGQDNERKLDDHESRLRSVERWKYGMPLATLAAIASAAAAVYSTK